ncbi:efflux RND transporter periplasmic adaptor subunit [Candidatus Cetobacterium colombiensis]|uniref:HlyD family efflux transporter periplasmic adaptor subunit n=1 Tax=Candidatus Cetobacterium colombiensis TaxID=3073100 RepID=A0ABU4WF00_9FUSO|nr:HlyD family efflux transporter periplasmic adaptor subunit [Candidatus Cetobacterium colombiensis]MDX8337146.1 HlyD family efflux transporter periplasmic adaptor subunit [Candidatus Cetobacterium colombiensis]
MNKKIMIGALVAALALGGYLAVDKVTGKNVKVSKIEIGNLSSSLLYSGMVAAGEVVPVYVEAPVLVESVLARVGQEVEPGDKLMTFSSKSVIENDKELRINELDIKDVKLKIADLDGGSLKLELDNRKLEMRNLEERIKGDERRLPVLASELRTLKEKAVAYKRLLDADGISSTEANRAATEAEGKAVEFEDLKTNLELNRQKFELSAVSFESLTRQLAIEEAKLKSNLEKLQLGNEILVRRAEQLKKPLEAPVAGVITAIDVSEGSNAFSGQRLLAISPKGESVVKVEVPMYGANSVLKGQRAMVRSSSSGGDLIYSGVVSRVSSVARESVLGGKNDKVIEVEVKISEKNELKPGFITDVEISSESSRSVATVSSFSVIEEGDKSYVYIVDEGRVRKTEIKVGTKTATDYEVLNLPLGTEVIVNPFKVSNGERVKAVI